VLAGPNQNSSCFANAIDMRKPAFDCDWTAAEVLDFSAGSPAQGVVGTVGLQNVAIEAAVIQTRACARRLADGQSPRFGSAD